MTSSVVEACLNDCGRAVVVLDVGGTVEYG